MPSAGFSSVTPPVSTTTYATNRIVGGLLTFSFPDGGGLLTRVRVTSKSSATPPALKLYLFDTNPTNTTWTDNTAPAIAAADSPFLRKIISLTGPVSDLGTNHTLWMQDGAAVEHFFSATNVYAVLVTQGSLSSGSTADLTVKLDSVSELVSGAPINTAVPTITGTAQMDEVLSASQGIWSNTIADASPVSFAYQWKRGGVAINGAIAPTYIPVNADIGSTLTVSVTATNEGGAAAGSATSSATSAVLIAKPLNTSIPTISGTEEVGQTLTADNGTWTNSPASFAYQWNRDEVAIGGATASTYVLAVADINAIITVSVTATNAGGSGQTIISPPSGQITDPANQGTSVATFGAVGDGVTDDTAALRTAAASEQPLWFPKTANFYKTTGVIILKDSVRSNGAEVRLLQDGTPATTIFRVVGNAAPLTIDGLILDGLYVTGSNANELSMGIELLSAANVTLSNCTIKNTIGDNIYLAYGGNGNTPCRNIVLRNNTLSNPYISNIALVHTEGVTIKTNTISKAFDKSASIVFSPKHDGVSNNRDVTLDSNNITCVHNCIRAAPNQTVPFTGLRVLNNVVFASANFFTGVCDAAHFKGNQFTATNYPSDAANARMFIFLAHSLNIVLDGNIDRTVPGVFVLYLSLLLLGNSTVAVNTNNTFVLAQPACPAIPWAFLSQDTDAGLVTQAVTEAQDLLSVIDTPCPAMIDLGTVVGGPPPPPPTNPIMQLVLDMSLAFPMPA